MGQESDAAKPRGIKTLADAPVHCLYTGVTQSGKTTLARMHARVLDRAGYDVLVYDPVRTETHGGDWPDRAEVHTDLQKFLSVCKSSRDKFVFVDEAADVFNLAQAENHWLLRRGRHAGLYVRMIATRPKNIAPNARTQCALAYVFRLSRDDAKEIFADFGHSAGEVREYANELDKGDFLVLESGSPSIDGFNVFNLSNRGRQ
jgi:hypothetical protein